MRSSQMGLTPPTACHGTQTTRSPEIGCLNAPEPSPQRRQNNRFSRSTGTPANNDTARVNSVDSPPQNKELEELTKLLITNPPTTPMVVGNNNTPFFDDMASILTRCRPKSPPEDVESDDDYSEYDSDDDEPIDWQRIFLEEKFDLVLDELKNKSSEKSPQDVYNEKCADHWHKLEEDAYEQFKQEKLEKEEKLMETTEKVLCKLEELQEEMDVAKQLVLMGDPSDDRNLNQILMQTAIDDAHYYVDAKLVHEREKMKINYKKLCRQQTLRVQPPPPKRKKIDSYYGALKSLQPEIGFLDDLCKLKDTVCTISDTTDSIKRLMDSIKRTVQFEEGDEVYDALLSRLEGLILLLLDLQSRNSLSEMLIPIVQYIKTWTAGKSLTKKVMRWVKQILMEDSSGERVDVEWEPITPGLKGETGWFSQNWMTLTQGAFGKRLAGLLNLLILGGMMPEKATNGLTDEVFKIIHVTAIRKAHPSIFHHLFGTLDWLADSVIPAILTKNYALLIFDEDADELDTQYRKCVDAIHLNMTGQMKLADEKYGIKDESAILVMLTSTSFAMLAMKKKVFDQPLLVREYNQRLVTLDKLACDLQAHWHESGLRIKPYAVLIRGPSSVGKSAIKTLVTHAVCRANGFPEGKEYSCTINGNDKYQSDFRSQHICVCFDDMGNTKPEKADGNPLFVLIQFINNMHCSALSPEADKKGKMDIRCKLVVVTTNTKDLHASLFSVNPASIMRRFDLVIDVALRKDSTGPTGGLHPKFAKTSMPDAWDIDLGVVDVKRVLGHDMQDLWGIRPVKKSATIVDLIDYLENITPGYFALQEEIVSSSTDLHNQQHCEHHSLYTLPCAKCALDGDFVPLVNQSEAFIQPGLKKETGGISSTYFQDLISKEFSDKPLTPDDFTFGLDAVPTEDDFIPEDQPWRDRAVDLIGQTRAKISDVLRDMRKKVERDPVTAGLLTLGALGLTGLAIHNMFVPKEQQYTSEGAIISRIAAAAKVPRTLIERDDKYKRIYSNVAVYPEASKSSTLEQLEAKIDRNLHMVVIQEYDEKLDIVHGEPEWCNAFPLGGIEWIFVDHCFKPDTTYKVSLRTHPSAGIKQFTALVNEANIRPVYGSDAVIVSLPSGGDTTNFQAYMHDELEMKDLKPGTPIFMYHVHKSVILNSPEEYVPPSAYKHSATIKEVKMCTVEDVGQYPGFTYHAETHKGMCGSMIFTAGRNPVLIGMHAAGDTDEKEGACVLLSKSAMNASKKKMKIGVKETTPLRSETYGVDTTVETVVHDFNPVHYLEKEKEHNVEIYGQHKLPQSRFTTDIRPSMIQAELIERGIELKDTAPTRKAVRPSRHRHLDKAAEVLPDMNPRIMALAKEDLMMKLKEQVFNEKSKFKEFVHPLSYDDALNGVPNVKGFEPVNPKTSMSYPLNGPKWKFMLDCELKEELGLKTARYVREVIAEDGTSNIVYELVFDKDKADVEAEVEFTMQCWLDGERSNVIFKTNCKDAAISFKKAAEDKIRIFSGAPVAMVVIARMLTLTLVNSMTYFPSEFESAVGVDAAGRDWEYLADHLSQFSGGKRCGDGDFSSYDQKLRPEVTLGAFEILRMCLVECGFTDEMLSLFDGLATECVYPIYEIDGLIAKVFGTGPSGHALTVVINGLCNCLYMRYAYYAMHERRLNVKLTMGVIPLFHLRVALMTYGDDNNFEVHPEEEVFNMMTVGEELSRIGVDYTDANKEISTVPFKTLEEISFLKRSFCVHPQLKKRVGTLTIDSIFRSLLLSKKIGKNCDETEAQIMAGNMQQALFEFYLHGEDVYWKYHEMFEDFRGLKDSGGYTIGNYYDPPTPEKIQERYFNSKCCYTKAQAILKGLKPQGGAMSVEEMEIFNSGTPLGPKLTQDETNRVWFSVLGFPPWPTIWKGREGTLARHCVRVAASTDDPIERHHYVAMAWFCGYCPNASNYMPTVAYGAIPMMTWQEIRYRKWTSGEDPTNVDRLWGGDFRLKRFSFHLKEMRIRFTEKDLKKAQLLAGIRYALGSMETTCIAFGIGSRESLHLNHWRNIHRKKQNLVLPLPEELTRYVWTFLQPDMVRLMITPDKFSVWVTPDLVGNETEANLHLNLAFGHPALATAAEELRNAYVGI